MLLMQEEYRNSQPLILAAASSGYRPLVNVLFYFWSSVGHATSCKGGIYKLEPLESSQEYKLKNDPCSFFWCLWTERNRRCFDGISTRNHSLKARCLNLFCCIKLTLESSKVENVSLLREPEDESDVLIECRNVYKSFGDKHILRGVSFKIRHGEAVGIIGPSGTGKSTILKIMAGLLAPDKGEVLIRGKLRNGLVSDDEISGLRIGLVFQSAALFDSLTVRENVGFLLYENSTMPEDQIAQLVTETLAAVGLKEVEDRLPSELSGGMKKRVALARSIIFDTTKDIVEPEVLLYDEPTAGLDPIASTVVEDLIRSVHMTGEDALGKPGKIASYVVVTHQHSTIKRAVDRLLFLYEGKVVWQGMTREFSTSTNPIVRQFASGNLDGPIKY